MKEGKISIPIELPIISKEIKIIQNTLNKKFKVYEEIAKETLIRCPNCEGVSSIKFLILRIIFKYIEADNMFGMGHWMCSHYEVNCDFCGESYGIKLTSEITSNLFFKVKEIQER